MFEDAHYQYHQGALDPDVWEGYERLYAAYARAPGFQAYWKERRTTFRPEFQRFIDEHPAPEVATWGSLKDRGAYLKI